MLSPSVARAAPAAERLLEREREVARISEAIECATRSDGRMLLIEGPFGSGKSRLLEEARHMGAERDMAVLQARCGQLETSYDFGVVMTLLEERISRAAPEEQQRLLRGRAQLAAPLLLPPSGASQPPGAPDEFSLLHGLYWCIVNLSEPSGCLLVVDDVHWADCLSLQFLSYLAQRLADLPVTMVVAMRTGEPPAHAELVAHLGGLASGAPIRPPALSKEGIREVLALAQVPDGMSEDFVDATWRVTQGNLYLLRELVLAIRDEPLHSSEQPASALARFAPESVGRSVVQRISRLGTDALAVAQACAILGEDLPLHCAALLAQLDPAAAAAASEQLVAAQVLVSTETTAFVHPMLRTALYAEYEPGRRPGAHLDVAHLLRDQALPADRVAHHLMLGVPTREPWARKALLDGAREAVRKGAPATATRYLHRLLEVIPQSERTASLLLEVGLVEADCGETTARSRLEEALAVLEDPLEQAPVLRALGETVYHSGRPDEAAAIFRRGAELFASVDPTVALEFEAAFTCAGQWVVSLRPDVATRLQHLVRRIPDDRPLRDAERTLLASLANFRSLTEPQAADHVALARRALDGGALLAQHTSESISINMALYALIQGGRPDEAERQADLLLEDARQRGSAPAFAEASMVRALALLHQGRLCEAIADAQTAIDGIQRGWVLLTPLPQGVLARCLIERGELEAAETVMREAPLTAPVVRNDGALAYVRWIEGHLCLRSGDPRAALENFLATGVALAPAGMVSPAITPWRHMAAIAAHAAGDDKRSRRLAEEAVTIGKSFGLPAAEAVGLRARSLTEDAATAGETLREALRLIEPTTARLEVAYTLLDLGELEKRVGNVASGRDYLRRALELAHQCGATALETRIRDALTALGARPRRPSLTGRDALTAGERRVADLAAQGITNRSIAERLFLTKSTVDWHLRNVYRKLDISSRDDLQAHLTDA